MIIKKDSRFLFIKLLDYKEYNFVEEHQKVINKEGYVWVLKLGRKINKKMMEELKDFNGDIIFKSSKRNGNKYYYCHVVNEAKVNKNPLVPQYYLELLDYEGYTLDDALENGDWFKIDSIKEIPDNMIKNIKSIRSGNDLTISSKARSPYVYMTNTENIQI